MAKIIVNVEAAIHKGGKWFMILRSNKEEHAAGTISMAGGTLEIEKDIDNALEETLKREVKEEVGLEIESKMEYVESKIFTTDVGEKVLDVVFLCKYRSGEAKAMSDEVADVFWLTKDDIMNHPQTPPWIKQSISLANKMV